MQLRIYIFHPPKLWNSLPIIDPLISLDVTKQKLKKKFVESLPKF